ncbi:hypothetical protein [Ancylobacter pratisalsi]|uniref:hypothetical protein n=1 Tax=Ancylobacter pratisalsi TaxID=1745854 RepID=UPI001AEDAECA|nr:hypothetical protein [Ancylobacter pratisalsi]
MDYLGGLRGTGQLLCAGAAVALTHYDFDGYLSNSGQVMSCGEIRLPASTLKQVFGRDDLSLRTDEGRLLNLRFSEKRLSPDGGAAHVDLVGELPAAQHWHRRSGWRAPQAAAAVPSSNRPLHSGVARA